MPAEDRTHLPFTACFAGSIRSMRLSGSFVLLAAGTVGVTGVVGVTGTVGVTTTFESQYAELIETMRGERLDFIGTDYAIDNRDAEKTILPLAQERGIAVLVYAPFGRTRLWRRVADRKVPEWAAEFGASTWAHFFLKYVASHPAVTAITPATSRAENMADNMGAATDGFPMARCESA